MRAVYSIVQYCPIFARHECLNIGIVVLCEETKTVNTLFLVNYDKIQSYYALESMDEVRFSSNVIALQNRIRTIEAKEYALKSFIAKESNQFQLTPPCGIIIQDPTQTIRDLLQELVM
jgi:Protein of unknown function (DUF3037)